MIPIFKRLMTIGACACAALSVLAGGLSDLPVKNVNGTRYYYYTVQPKETVYSLCRRFGVSREDFLRYNPSAADGLKIDQVLLFPCDATSTISATSVTQQPAYSETEQRRPSVSFAGNNSAEQPIGTIAYTVQPKETPYSISKRFGMTLDEFYSLNPAARNGGVRIDEQVWVKDERKDAPRHESVTENRYEVKPGDTFYSIARTYGVDVHELQGANPGVSVLVPGQNIVLPQSCAEPVQPTEPASGAETAVPVIDTDVNTITVAVALPFMLEQNPRPRQAQLFTEFYKGFLLAVDSMRNCGKKIRVLTFDTKGTDAGLAEVLGDPHMASAQVIIGPDNAAHVEHIGKYALDHNASVLNIFAVKDESYKTMPNVMNSIVPHATMYDKAVNYLINEYPDYTPVILKRTDGQQDKAEFIAKLKKLLSERGRDYVEIDFEKRLSSADIEQLKADQKYAFIPMSSKLTELKAVLPELSKFAQTFSVPSNFQLWGYPEWLSFRGEPLQAMHKLNATIFSRFFNTGTPDPDADRVNESFGRWYGGQMINVIPSQGLYGFDTGMYLINALLVNGGDFSRFTPVYDGVQNCFSFVRGEGQQGWVNNEMFIIGYRPEIVVTKISL